MLTQEQRAHYETFGFVVMRRLFPPEEMAAITREFEGVLAEERGGGGFDGAKRQGNLRFIERRPSLLRLVEDDRVHEPIADLLGPDFIFLASEGNLMVGNTSWHPDGYRPNAHPDGWQLSLERIAVTFYLDPVRRDTGCLRVIPGSHRPPLYESLKRLLADRDPLVYAALKPLFASRDDPNALVFGVPQPELPCFALESDPGDVIFWNCNLWHASFGGRAGRRMFRVAFAENPKTHEQIEYLRLEYQRALDGKRQLAADRQAAALHEPAFLDSDRPRVRRLASRLVELGLQ